jgi:hypothetical protein
MNFDHRQYVPCLRWKRGEYEAMSRLPLSSKRVLTPLIEVPEFGSPEHGWDHETASKAKTIDKHLALFAKRVYKKWDDSPCFVDLSLISSAQRMKNGVHPIHFIFKELRGLLGCQAIPVTGLLRDDKYQQEIKATSAKDKNGICLRITIEQAERRTIKNEMDSLLSTLKFQSTDCDLILDLGAPTNFRPLDGFAMAIQGIVGKLPYLNDWRTFTLLGTSFPETMGSIKEGAEIVPRYEWQLYKMLIAGLRGTGLRPPSFGDYAINHPKVLELDMRQVNPSATIRYTIDDSWYIVKGKKVKKDKKDEGEKVKDKKYGFEQYRYLSKSIINSKYYFGTTFSWGDDYIQKCATGKSGTGSLSTWRQVGTSHHIEKVIRDIASFYAS